MAFVAASLTASAQSLEQFFINTPESVLPYVKKLDREALLLSYDASKDTCCTMSVAMGDSPITVTHKSSELIVFHPSKALTQEYAILPSDNDSVFCVVSTYMAPEAESNVKIYDKEWNLLSVVDVNDKAKLARPDTISESRFAEIIKTQEIKMTVANIDKKDTQTLNLQYSMALMNSEEKKAFLPVVLQTNLKWNGETFN